MLLNRERANRIMDEYGLDALIATAVNNITYLSDYSSLEFILEPQAQRYCILPRDEAVEAVLIVPMVELETVAEGATWFPDIRVYGITYIAVLPGARLKGAEKCLQELRSSCPREETPLGALLAALKEKRLAEARIGLEAANIGFPLVDRLREELPRAEFIPASQIFYEIRMVKTPEEIERLKASSAINEEALTEVIAMVQEDVNFMELFERYQRGVTERGAIPRLWSAGHGTASAASFTPSDTLVQRGDIVRLDTGCAYQSYFSDTCRVVCVGEPSQRISQCYQAITAGARAALNLVRPGVMAAEIFQAAFEAIRENGLPNFRRHHLGHSIGYENHEPPELASSEYLPGFKDYPLEEGMVLCVEMPYYELGTGGMNIEDTILITEDGWEYITTMSRELLVV